MSSNDIQPLCNPSTELVQPQATKLSTSRQKFMNKIMLTRKYRIVYTLFGIVVGFTLGAYFTTRGDGSERKCFRSPFPEDPSSLKFISDAIDFGRSEEDPLSIIGLTDSSANVHNNQKNLLFVGVITAEKYLATRAVAVYKTWGSDIPGKIAFFSSEESKRPANMPNLPLVSLPNVDDSYPPQKKSFLMLKYMWEKYGDHFEWFFRADDDVYIRPDKIEDLLRSLDSKKLYFIGQAGKGNPEEFGLLSLEEDENFCMGGPGMIMSRETLSRMAPHIKHCLHNLFTTHEDVEVGRCVQKFAGVPCSWAYNMLDIFYHNQSGKDAYKGELKTKDVHVAYTLHPFKYPEYQYKIHNYMRGLQLEELQHTNVLLHREIVTMANFLNTTHDKIFPHSPIREDTLGDTSVLVACYKVLNRSFKGPEITKSEVVYAIKLQKNSKATGPDSIHVEVLKIIAEKDNKGSIPNLNQYKPWRVTDVLKWEFFGRTIYSDDNLNPRRRPETHLKAGIEDVVREVMSYINQYAEQRGRIIDFKDVLYGYRRVDPVHGLTYVMDLLLIYKKFRGAKMQAPVRRHAYLHRSFTGLEIRETFDGKQIYTQEDIETIHMQDVKEKNNEDQDDEEETTGGLKGALEVGLLKLGETFPGLVPPSALERHKNRDIKQKIVNFILPLAGRFKTFQRFIGVFEKVCLQNKEKVTLTAVLFPSKKENTYNATLDVIKDLQFRYPDTKISVVEVAESFARALALEVGANSVSEPNDLLFFVDVDMIFSTGTLDRIRTNTVRGISAYYPIVYSEFDPYILYNSTLSPNHYVVNQESGYWRQFGFGICSLYKSDLHKVGSFDTSIKGWGKEDVDLFNKFIANAENITVFRSVDPGLVHIFHVVECDPDLVESQFKMCRNTRADTYGAVGPLAKLLYSAQDKYFKYAKNRSKSNKS